MLFEIQRSVLVVVVGWAALFARKSVVKRLTVTVVYVVISGQNEYLRLMGS